MGRGHEARSTIRFVFALPRWRAKWTGGVNGTRTLRWLLSMCDEYMEFHR